MSKKPVVGLEFYFRPESAMMRFHLRFSASSLMDNVYYFHCGEDVLGKVTIDSKLRQPVTMEVYTPHFTAMDLSNALGIVRKLIKNDDNYAKLFPDGNPPFDMLPCKYVYTIVDTATEDLPSPTPTWDSVGELLENPNNRELLASNARYQIGRCHIVLVETLPAESAFLYEPLAEPAV